MTRKTNKYRMSTLNKLKKFKMITLQLKQIKFSDVLELGIHHLNINFQIINFKATAPTKYVNIKSQELKQKSLKQNKYWWMKPYKI